MARTAVPTKRPHAHTHTLGPADRDKLAVVVRDCAPALVLEQRLSVPDAPGETLAEALAPSAPAVPIHVLRACINDASTSALLASAMAQDANEADSARLLNDVDDFQRTTLALLDDPTQPPTKVRRYLLHRTLATGVDLFTSSAVLSDQDLAALDSLPDTDLIALHPIAPAHSPPPPPPPPPALGDASPALPPPQFAPHVPPAARFGRAPGLHGAMARQRLEPVDPANPARQPTHLLAYPSPFLSALAPTHDSAGATEPYARTAARALHARRARAWERAMAPDEDDDDDESSLSEAERETLRALGLDADALLAAVHGGGDGGGRGEGEGEAAWTWERLERNVELIARVGRAQVVRARRAARGGGEVSVDEGAGGATKAGTRERKDAAALLSSLTSLLASHASTRTPRTTTATSRTPSLVPPTAVLRTLTPLLLAARAAEPAYTGTLDDANFRAVREGQIGSASAIPSANAGPDGLAVGPASGPGAAPVGAGEGQGQGIVSEADDLKVEG